MPKIKDREYIISQTSTLYFHTLQVSVFGCYLDVYMEISFLCRMNAMLLTSPLSTQLNFVLVFLKVIQLERDNSQCLTSFNVHATQLD